MKNLLIYQTKYGSTRQYAEWIAEQSAVDMFHIDEFNIKTLALYDTVIFGSYVRMGKLVDADFINKNWQILQNKKVIMFSVSAAPAGSKVVMEAFEKSVPEPLRKHITLFQFQGRMQNPDAKDTVLLFLAKWLFYIKLLCKGKLPKFNPYGPFDKMDKAKINPLMTLINTTH